MLAWLRLLVDPRDAAAVVRALARPPIELRQVELARVIQIARRRKLDLVLGLAAATESPQVPPEARERIQRFLELHAGIAADFAGQPPQAFLTRLIERVHCERLLGVNAERSRGDGLEQLQQLAGEFLLSTPRAGGRELAAHLVEALPGAQRQTPDVAATQPHAAEEPSLDSEERTERELQATLGLLRDQLLDGVNHLGGRLGELRLDTELDIAHGVVRYLELLKVATLLQRPAGQGLGEALADVNARLHAAVTPLQREILQTSPLDRTLLAHGEHEQNGAGSAAPASEHALARALVPREQHSLGPFLPRKGSGLALSASDIQTYRSCPLRYKYARVLRIPVEQTLPQRFGIVVHQTLERYHSEDGGSLERMLVLLDGCWRRAGLGEDGEQGELRRKALDALTRYHARLGASASQPVWFERAFSFRLGRHHLRGRVDRIDRLAPGAEAEYELIDYKTSRPRTPEQLGQDIQLSLYALAAREDWRLESTQQAYYYVLDDLIVPVPEPATDAQSLESIVLEVGDGILAQEFEPTPSPAACAMCDYRIVCPAAVE